MTLISEAAINTPSTYIWAAPTFDQARTGMDEMRKAFGDVAAFNQSRMSVVMPNGGTVLFRSLDNPNSLRGKTAAGVVIDEAAEAPAIGWHEVLRPMLIDTGGWADFLYTPKGRNWVWEDWMRGEARADTALFHAPTLGVEFDGGNLVRKPHPLENPDIPFAEIDALFRTTPERSFRQEILAEFVADGGGVFRNVRACATAQRQDGPVAGHEYVFGVDWGRTGDYTVIAVVDATARALVYMDRYSGVDFKTQIQRVQALAERFRPYVCYVEQNAMGGPLVEELAALNLPSYAINTSNQSKRADIDALTLAFERGAISIINDATLIGELEAFESEKTETGLVKFSAPQGMHDDCVMALSFAWRGVGGGIFA